MGSMPKSLDLNMQSAGIPGTSLEVSRIGIGTWAIGGWMWGGSEEKESIETIRAALDQGITVVDTAPVYGFGRSEEIVGKALAASVLRARAVIATKAGLEWRDGSVFRNASRARITREVEDSLRRLRTDYIDIYQVHCPDPLVPMEETASAMASLYNQGKIRAIGVSNFSVAQMDAFRRVAPLHVLQSPYNLFERGIEDGILPYCRRINIAAPYSGWICSRNTATASVSSISRCAGCWTRASRSRCGARAIPTSSHRSPKWAAGRSRPAPRPKSTACCASGSPTRWGPSSWHRRRARNDSINEATRYPPEGDSKM